VDILRELDALRQQRGAHLPTLRLVESMLTRHAGMRLTLLPGAGRAGRMAQARTAVNFDDPQAKNIGKIVATLGVSRSTAWRFYRELEIERAKSVQQHVPQSVKSL
jgi:hypothetical protein